MTETNPIRGFWSLLKPAAASLSVDDQAVDGCRMSNSRLLPNVETMMASPLPSGTVIAN